MGGFFGFVWRQWTVTPKPLPPSTTFEGKTILITGGYIGLGFEAAKELASRKPAKLIITVRNVQKGESAREAILKEGHDVEIELWELEYDSYDSIAAFGKRVQELDRLDYALPNAGIKQMRYVISKNGHESNLQVNHIGTSLVSLQVLPVLQRTAKQTRMPSRLTIVTSEGHFWVPFNERLAPNVLARMDDEETFGSQMQRYYTTKLLNILWTRELASKTQSDEVVVNAVNPGFCYSGLHRHSSGAINIFLWLFGWKTEVGARCLTDALVMHEDSHGSYLSEQKVVP